MRNKMEKPIPVGNDQRLAGHHWLEVLDCDNHSFGYVVMMWQPTAQEWCQSGSHGTYNGNLDIRGYRYVKPIPMPEIGE